MAGGAGVAGVGLLGYPPNTDACRSANRPLARGEFERGGFFHQWCESCPQVIKITCSIRCGEKCAITNFESLENIYWLGIAKRR